MEEAHSRLSARFHDLEQLWSPADVAASEVVYRALLLEGQKLMGRERSYLIELYSLIARAEAYQEKFTEARTTLESGRLYILAKTPSHAKKVSRKLGPYLLTQQRITLQLRSLNFWLPPNRRKLSNLGLRVRSRSLAANYLLMSGSRIISPLSSSE